MGKIIKEKENFEKRKDIRINIDNRVAADMGLATTQGIALIDKIKRQCIFKNLSSHGSFILLACMPKLIMEKTILLSLILAQDKEIIQIEGKIVRYEDIQNRKDIYGIAVQFINENIPINYQRIINNYLEKLENLAKHNKYC